MPTAYAYGRISRDENKQVYSRAAQEHDCTEAWKRHHIAAALPWGGFFFDPDISGTVPMFERAAGRELNMRLAPGDYLFIAKVDRAFRNLLDQIHSTDILLARKVLFQFLDLGVDTSTDSGILILNIMASVAQFERQRIRHRISDALAEKKRQGLPCGWQAPIGWKITGKGRNGMVVPFYEERALCEEVAKRRAAGESLNEISLRFKRERRPLLPRHRPRLKPGYKFFRNDLWSLVWLQRAARAYRTGFPCASVEVRTKYLREIGVIRKRVGEDGAAELTDGQAELLANGAP